MAIMEYYLAANEQTPEERVKTLKDFLSSFRPEDANAIFTWVTNNEGKRFPRDFGTKTVKINLQDPWFLERRAVKTTLEYFADYGGIPKSDAKDLETSMGTDLVFMLVYNPTKDHNCLSGKPITDYAGEREYFQPNSPDSDNFGYTIINSRLRRYRYDLAQKLIELLNLEPLKNIEVDIDNDIEFTGFINQTLVRAQAELEKKRILNNSISPELRKTFIQLNCFDQLLEDSGFISIKDDSNIITKDRYTFSGETIDIKGSQFAEHADSEQYTTKLVKIILNSLKSANTNETIGLKGFETAMSYVLDWALSGNDMVAFKYATQDVSLNIYDIITRYLSKGTPPKKVKNALLTIKESLFSNNVPNSIKELFTIQASTTVKSIYFEYTYGTFRKKDKGTGKITIIQGISCKKAEDKILDETKWEAVNKITSKVDYYLEPKNKVARKNFLTKWGLKISDKKIVFEGPDRMKITITRNEDGTFSWDANGDYSSPTYNKFWRRLLQEVLDLPLGDVTKCRTALQETGFVTKRNDGKLEYHIVEPFKQMLSGVFWMVANNDRIGFTKSTGEYHYGKLFGLADSAGVFLNQLLNSEFSSVTKDLNGHNLPAHQMTSLGYRTKHLIAAIKRDIDNVKKNNFFVKNIAALGETMMREGVQVNGRTKGVADLRSNEVLQLQTITDFYNPLMYPPKKPGSKELQQTSIFLQPMVYSDKTRHILKEIILDGLTFASGQEILATIRRLTKSFGKEAEGLEALFIAEICRVRGDEAFRTLSKKLQRFAKALLIPIPDVGITKENIDSILEKVNEKLAYYKSIDELRAIFKNSGVELYEENDVNKTESGLEINPLLVHHFNTFGKNNADEYFNFVKAQFAFDLVGDRFRLDTFLDPSLNAFVNSLSEKKRKEWYNSNSGNITLFKIYDKSGKEVFDAKTAEEVREKGYRVELNPILNGFFWSHNLFGQQIRTIQMGADYSIKGGGSDWESDTDARFIAQSKRAMGQGSTVLKYDTTRKYGTASRIEYTVFEDPAEKIYNPKGHNKKGDYDKELVADGGGYISPIQFILEQWSLPGNAKLRADVVKSIIQDIDSEGNLQQIKWAGTCLSNLRRRGAPMSEGVNLDRMFKLMHSKHKITLNFNLNKFYGKSVYMDGEHSITCTDDIYFFDKETGKYWRIDKIDTNTVSHTATRTVTEVDETGKVVGPTITEDPKLIENLYDIHELFGGKWCKVKRGNELVYSEINNEILANIVCSESLKNKFVQYAVNKSAMKVGMSNVNHWSIFKRNATDDNLWTAEMSIQHSGVQLDAGHETEGGEVTEMSQLVSLLIEKGFCTDIVDDIYKNIAEVTRSGLKKFANADKIKVLISEILVDSFRNSSSNVNSIADDFIKQLINRVKTEGIDLEVPFSSRSIKNKFATAVCAAINSLALRRRYPGLGTVQTPSYDSMMYHRIGQQTYTYESVINKYRKSLRAAGFNSVDDLFEDITSPEGFVSDDYVQRMKGVQDGNGNFVIDEINPRAIDFEDTIIFRDQNGKLRYQRIKHIEDYYKFRYGPYTEVYRWNTKPRNLVQQLTYFTVLTNSQTTRYTIYDLDISRAIQYLSAYKYWQKSPERQQIEDFLFAFTGKRGPELDSFIGTIACRDLVINLQKQLQELLLGFTPGITVTINGEEHTILDVQHKPADIMMGNPWMKIFNFKESDQVGDILSQGAAFFLNRLRETYAKINVQEVPSSGYDAVLYEPDGTPILIQFGGEENYNRLDPSKLLPGNSFSKSTGRLRYKDEDLGDVNGVVEFTYTSTTNKSYKVLRIKDASRINGFMKTKLFSELRLNVSEKTPNFGQLCEFLFKNKVVNGKAIRDFYIGNLKIKKGTNLSKMFANAKYQEALLNAFNEVQNQRLERRFSSLATKQFNAFSKLLNVVGTRIPSQALQSCAACRIVGFTGSNTNDVYLPRILTWCAGSDYKSIL